MDSEGATRAYDAKSLGIDWGEEECEDVPHGTWAMGALCTYWGADHSPVGNSVVKSLSKPGPTYGSESSAHGREIIHGSDISTIAKGS
jgi:hypothetical protein